MAEDLKTNVNQDEKMASESATNSTTDTQVDKPNYVPQGRVNEITAKHRSEVEAMQTQLDGYSKADKAREMKELTDRGEQDKIITNLQAELDTLSPYKAKYVTLVDAQKAEYLKDLPEDLQEKYKLHDLDVVKDIHSAYTSNAKPSTNMANANTPVRNVSMDGKSILDSDMSWNEKLASFKNKPKN